MRSILHAVGVLPLLLVSTLASPDPPIEKNGRSLTPAIKSTHQISDVTIAARDLFSRQSCGRTETECADGCCESLTKCCDGKSCTPLGGECCSNGGSCGTGEICCGDGCAPQLATCCGDASSGEGVYCTLAKGSCTEVDGKWMCEKYGSYDQASGMGAPAWGAIGGLVAAGVGAGML